MKSLLYITNATIPSSRANTIQVVRLCEGFAQNGIDTTLCIPKQQNVNEEQIREYYGIKSKHMRIRLLPFLRMLPEDNSFLGRIRLYSFLCTSMIYAFLKYRDVVLTRDWRYGLFLRGVIYNLHATLDKVPSWLFQKAINNMCAIVVPNKVIASSVRAHKTLQTPVKVISNGVSLAQFKNIVKTDARNELKSILKTTLTDKKVVIYTGKFAEHKGIEVLAAAAHLLPKEYIVACFGGSSEEIKILKKKFPSDQLFFQPYIAPSQITKIICAADVLVLPNIPTNNKASHDTSPIKLFEYMASGVPVVASDLQTIREIANDQEVWFTEANNPKALAAQIQKTQENYDDAYARARQAQESVQAYSWECRAEQICSVATDYCGV